MTNRRSTDESTIVVRTSRSPVHMRRMCLAVQGEQVVQGADIEKHFFVVGKDEVCDLVLDDPTVSKVHFKITKENETFTIMDLDSTNGTFLDDTRIKEAYLSPGAQIRAGNVEMVFQPVYRKPDRRNPKATSFGNLVAASTAMKSIMGVMRKVAESGTTVLLQGETGVGKSALAKAIHEESPRRKRPFVVFDCASVPPTLIESELFGTEKGAFTGAVSARPGACERAQGGTLFIDEIEDLSLDLQIKLLRVLEEREVRRLGGARPIKLDIQVITASKTNLATAAAEGRFRQDLYYRIAVVCIDVPSLRQRQRDIPILCDHFLKEAGGGLQWDHLAPVVQKRLSNYSWPGNLRELRNALERILCIGPEGLFEGNMPGRNSQGMNSVVIDTSRPFKLAKEELVSQFEKEYLEKLLVESEGRIAPAVRAAGLNRKYFYDLLKKHGLQGRNA